MKIVSLVSFLLVAFCAAPSRPGVKVTIAYTGNMGVSIRTDKAFVLVDGLHEYYGPEYVNTPDTIRQQILAKEAGYDRMDIALFTHFHRDHFSVTYSRAFLQSSGARRIGGPPQVIDSLKVEQCMNARNRNGLLLADDNTALSIKAFDIPHTWPQRHAKVENTGYVITMEGLSIFHIGDADTDPAVFRKLGTGKIDVLIVPVWFLMDKKGVEIIEQIIKPARVIATHISPGAKEDWEGYKLHNIPTYFFTQISQAVVLN